MGKAGIYLSLLLFSIAAISCAHPVAKLAPGSDLIFTGTVQLLNSSTIDAYPASGLAVVKVDSVIRGSGLSMPEERQVTVRLKDPGSVKRNDRRIFFAQVQYVGEGIGVTEMGSFPVRNPEEVAQMKEKIDRAMREHADKELTARLAKAELVVVGKVVAVVKMKRPVAASEHDPEWGEAEIGIEKVLKGVYPKRRITILFAMSNDVMWYKSPKFKANVEGIWLLRTYEFAGRKLERLAVLEKKDYLGKEEESRIIRLLKK